MPYLSSDEVYKRYLKDARNSSHFVWFTANLTFYETSQDHWIFAFTEQSDITLIALEPLIPGSPTHYSSNEEAAFDRAWSEFCKVVAPKITAFVAVYAPFKDLLMKKNFQCLNIGQEPWVELSNAIPTGNVAKGVRAARNQALHAGVTVEEWHGKSILEDPEKKKTVASLFKNWKSKHLVQLGGFLNATDPLSHACDRRYFVAKSKKNEVEGYLIATPVAGIGSYFLEDLVLSAKATRGVGELLTWEVLQQLSLSNPSGLASLGVVSVTCIDETSCQGLPPKIAFLAVRLPQFLKKIYNFNGLETFRKRFKPRFWEGVYLVLKNESQGKCSDTQAWLKTWLALGLAFRPRFALTFTWLKTKILNAFRKHPLSWGVASLSFTLFAIVNRFGDIQNQGLHSFGFSADATLSQWFYRTITSDYIYFDANHFWMWGGLLIFVLRWAENTQRLSFLIPFYFLVSFFDDFLNYYLILYPFKFLEPSLYSRLIHYKDIGGSLALVTLLGLQLCQFRKNREIAFTVLMLGLVFGFVFKSLKFQILVLNLNHFLFLSLGFISGKLKFEWERRRNERASKQKPPQAPILPQLDTQKRAA